MRRECILFVYRAKILCVCDVCTLQFTLGEGCGFLRLVCLGKVARDVICLINGLTTSSSAFIRAELMINHLTV